MMGVVEREAIADAHVSAPRSGVAMAVVGTSHSSAAMAMGLEAPTQLRGGPKVAARLRCADFGWQPDVPALLAHAAKTAERGAVAFGAILLEGEPGAGRTHLARRLAHIAGVPHVTIDLPGGGLEQLAQRRRGPDFVLPTAPVLAIAACRAANPIISLLGVDELREDAQELLVRMIDPATSSRWPDPAAGGTVDLSHVSWFIQSHLPDRIAPRLAHLLRPVRMFWPTDDAVALHAIEVLAEAAIDENVATPPTTVIEQIIGETQSRHAQRSTAALYRRACDLICQEAR